MVEAEAAGGSPGRTNEKLAPSGKSQIGNRICQEKEEVQEIGQACSLLTTRYSLLLVTSPALG